MKNVITHVLAALLGTAVLVGSYTAYQLTNRPEPIAAVTFDKLEQGMGTVLEENDVLKEYGVYLSPKNTFKVIAVAPNDPYALNALATDIVDGTYVLKDPRKPSLGWAPLKGIFTREVAFVRLGLAQNLVELNLLLAGDIVVRVTMLDKRSNEIFSYAILAPNGKVKYELYGASTPGEVSETDTVTTTTTP